jgi:ribosome-associated protein
MIERNFESEFEFITSRSSGPGGQNVNKTETRVELRFNISKSGLLSEEEKEKITGKLENRISKDGILSVSSQKSRSQLDNKIDCIRKFYDLLESALKQEKKRKPTKIPRAVQLERLDRKKKNAEKKQNRKKDFL